MSWWDVTLAVLAAIAVVAVPGVVLGLAVGLRGFRLWATAAPAGLTVITLASLAAPLVGLGWGVIPVAVVLVALTAVVLGLRWLLWRSVTPGGGIGGIGWIAVAGATALVGLQVVRVIGSPDAISQTFDNIFHLNGIRFALETANASPLHLGQMTSASSGGVPFYPSAWHALGSLIVQLTGVDIPVASNAMTIVFAAVVWPSSVLLLTRTLFGRSPALLITAAAVSAAIPAFPLLMIDYGVLFPLMMSLSMVPVAIAMIVLATGASTWRERWPYLVAALGLLPGIIIAHPGGFVALLVFATLILLVRVVSFLRAAPSRRAVVGAVILTVAYLGVVAAAWYVLRPVAEARTWGTYETVAQAIGEVVGVAPWGAPINILVAALVLIGAVRALRRRRRTDVIALLIFLAAAGLYVVVAGLPYWTLRDIITGAWYNNGPRLAAILPLAWVPLAALGGQALWAWVTARLSVGQRGARRLAAVVAVAVLAIVPQVSTMRHAVNSAHGMFVYSEDSRLLTVDELALIERLPEEVPAEATVVGSAWTGAGLAYALADRKVLMPHTLMDITPEIRAILDGLDTAEPGSAACRAITDTNSQFVLDFGDQEINDSHNPYPGLDHLDTSSAVELVDEAGEAKLYKITGCD